MKAMKYCLAILMCCVWLCSCSGGGNRSLREADSIMEENPDSAYTIIEGVELSSLHDDDDIALYWLLRTQARVKTDRIDESDTLALKPMSYYNDNRHTLNQIKVLYYMSEVASVSGRQSDRIRFLLRAKDKVDEFDNPYWRAKVYESLSFLYCENCMSEKSIESSMIARDNYLMSGHELNALYCMLDLATDHLTT